MISFQNLELKRVETTPNMCFMDPIPEYSNMAPFFVCECMRLTCLKLRKIIDLFNKENKNIWIKPTNENCELKSDFEFENLQKIIRLIDPKLFLIKIIF